LKGKYQAYDYAEEIGLEVPEWSQDGIAIKVYKIPLDKIYYNDDNGRIATWISVYEDFDANKPLDELSFEEYNLKIQDLLKKSNTPISYKKTYTDVKLKGQIKPGVVLADGRVVSGNRRFTVLRELYNETGNSRFGYFKCFIVDKDLEKEDDRKYIKTIERLTQYGVDEKVDYDAIDRLVDIYNDLIGPKKIWTLKEYSKKLSLKQSDVNLLYFKSAVMVDYLNYINRPFKFHIAKKHKIDGPLQELARLYMKISGQEWNRIRVVFYSYFVESGDTTRTVRELIRVYKNNSDKFNSLVEKCILDIEQKEEAFIEDLSKDINQNLLDNEDLNLEVSEEIESVLSNETKQEIFEATNRAKIEEKRIEKVKKIFQSIDTLVLSIDDTIKIMNPEERKNLEIRIKEIERVIEEIKGE